MERGTLAWDNTEPDTLFPNVRKLVLIQKIDRVHAHQQLALILQWDHVCHKGHADVVRVLLKAGAEVNARKNAGNTPLRMAAME